MNNASHPWKNRFENELKLKEARKERKRIYERGELHKSWQRENYRLKHGIPLELPVMTPKERASNAAKVRWQKIK